MDAFEIRYLLRRARAHRLLGQVARCGEARAIHRQFVKNYQNLLLEMRRVRPMPAGPVILSVAAKSLGQPRRSPFVVGAAPAGSLLPIKTPREEILA